MGRIMSIDIKRVFSHFSKWEDYRNGMYDDCSEEFYKSKEKAVKVLSNKDTLKDDFEDMLSDWVICSEFNMTNRSSNRNSWLGRAVCCYKVNAPGIVTKDAWWELTEEQRIQANKIADKVIKEWEMNYIADLEDQICLNLD